MRTMKVVIAEDEPRNIAILKKILEEDCEDVEVAGTAKTVEKAIELIKLTKPDALFLDVEMPPHKGFDILKAFPKVDFEVIFTTSYEKYAVQAIKFAALDYLLKPISIEEVKQALEKVSKRRKGQSNELVAILKEDRKSVV